MQKMICQDVGRVLGKTLMNSGMMTQGKGKRGDQEEWDKSLGSQLVTGRAKGCDCHWDLSFST